MKTVTIKVETPEAPNWVTEAGVEAAWAWKASLEWRADAANAETPAYKALLIRDARRAYHGGEPGWNYEGE